MSLDAGRPQRRRPTRRQELLADAGLAWATQEHQRMFWTRYNKRRRPAAVPLGDVAKSLIGGRDLRAALKLGALRDLWEQTVPSSMRAHSEVVGLRGGRLTVMVDDPSIRFTFEREIGRKLLAAIRAGKGGTAIREISYKLGTIERDDMNDTLGSDGDE